MTIVPDASGNCETDNSLERVNTQGSGSPVGSVTPSYVNELYGDTDTGAIYRAYGTTNTSWRLLGTEPQPC